MSNQTKLKTIVYILCLIGITMVYSASNVVALDKFNDSYYYFKRQFLFLILGLGIMNIVSHIDYHLFLKHAFSLLFVGYGLLILVLIPGIGQVRGGSQSWFSLGPISFQPSEVFKVAIILYIANYLGIHYHQTKKLKAMIKPLFFLMLGFGLIMLQPDFGSGFVMVGSSVFLIFVSCFPLRYFFFLGVLGVIGATGLIIAAPYRLTRLLSFLDPFSDPLGSGFQAIQSLYAIGPGGLLGVGFNQSFQKRFYLPEPQTDFIFAIYAEEFGLVGSVFLVLLFFMFCYVGIKIALNSDDLEGFYLAFGIVCLLGLQTIVNLCVVTGLFPVTGQTCVLEIVVLQGYTGVYRGENVNFHLFFCPFE